jgi:hypothetical protein
MDSTRADGSGAGRGVSGPSVERRFDRRAFDAMMGMKKIDVAVIEAVRRG